MSKNKIVALVVLLVVALLGVGGSYWAYKKIQKQRNQEYRYGGSLPIKEGFNAEAFKALVLSEDVLDSVVDSHDLVNAWQMSDAGSAKMHLREKFKVKVVGLEVQVAYQDRDKDRAKKILMSLMDGYSKKVGKPQSR